MSQFTLTAEEDALVITALHNKAAQYSAMFGTADPEMEALIAKVEGQLMAPEVAVEEISAVVEAPVEESPVVDITTN